MSSTNGTNGNHAQPSGPIVREVLLDSGVIVRVTPLSPHTVALIEQRGREQFPAPDEEQFRKPVPNAAIDGDTFIDKQDPNYIRQYQESYQGFLRYKTMAYLEASLEFPDGKDALIAQFADRIATLRKFADLPKDAWEATFWHGIISSPADHETLLYAAENSLPLSGEEIADGLRLFRYNVQGKRPSQVANTRKLLARSLQERAQDKSRK